jgi:hypothetical protein
MPIAWCNEAAQSLNVLCYAAHHEAGRDTPMKRTIFSRPIRLELGVALATLALSTPLGVAVAQSLTLPGGVTLQLGQRGATTTVTLRRQGQTLRATLPPDESIYARSMRTSTLVGAASGAFAVVSSDYDSNPAGGSYQCGAGTETVIRVIALRPIPHKTFGQLVASCWLAVDAGDVKWDKARQRLSIERITYSSPDTPDKTSDQDGAAAHTLTVYHVAADGAVAVVSSEWLP